MLAKFEYGEIGFSRMEFLMTFGVKTFSLCLLCPVPWDIVSIFSYVCSEILFYNMYVIFNSIHTIYNYTYV